MGPFTRRYRFFLIPFFVWLSLAGILVSLTERNALHLWLNGFHHASADFFFRYLTYMGDGVFAAFMVLLAFFYKIRFGIAGLIGLISSSIVTQLLKRQVFNYMYRPAKVFEGMSADLHFVEGVDLHHHFSFPSGHATAAFSVFLLLAVIFNRPIWQFVCFVLAILIAFSRVYISQHFFEDILAGSIIGTLFMTLAFVWLEDKKWGSLGLLNWIEKRLRSEAS
jgi:membrane-associated phospholipid phosphatase